MRVRGWTTAVAAAIVAAAALASCGRDGGEDGSSKHAEGASGPAPEVVLSRYYAALARGDGRTACALLTPAARDAMKELPEGSRASSCVGAVALLARSDIPLRDVQVADLQVSGTQATARVTSRTPAYESGVLLSRGAAGWRLAYPPGGVSKFDTPPGIKPHEDDDHKRRG
jgi:hypothetical protein